MMLSSHYIVLLLIRAKKKTTTHHPKENLILEPVAIQSFISVHLFFFGKFHIYENKWKISLMRYSNQSTRQTYFDDRDVYYSHSLLKVDIV